MKPANATVATIDTLLRAVERGDVNTLLRHIDDNIDVDSRTWIISHSRDGRCDYFRETVATLQPLPR